jgi:hypothetical protein
VTHLWQRLILVVLKFVVLGNLFLRKRLSSMRCVKIMSLRKQLIVIRGCTSSNWRHNSDDIDDG